MNVTLRVLSWSFFAAAWWVRPSQALSQVDVDTTWIQPASVTGGFASVTAENAPRALVVLGAEEVGGSAATSLADVLEAVPGVDIRQRGALGVQTDLSVRGGTFEQTALWVDGVRWSAPQTGHHLLNVPIDPEDIRQVEVFRGGASSALGTGAMTGAVSLRTGPSLRDGTLLVAESGSKGYLRAKVRVDFGDDLASATSGTVMRHRISASRAGTSGMLGRGTNTDASLLRARYAGWMAGEWGSLRISGGLANKAFGAQNFYTSTYPTQFETTLTGQAQATYTKAWGRSTLDASAHHRTHVDAFHLYRNHDDYYVPTDVLDSAGNVTGSVLVMAGDTAASWYSGPNNHLSRTTGGRIHWRHRTDWGETYVAVDLRQEGVVSNVLGVDSLGRDDEGTLYPLGDVRWNTDAALGQTLRLGRFSLSGTAAWNHNTMFGLRFVPGVEASVALNDEGSVLFASANRSVRHPSFTDLYYRVGGAVGSRDLVSEWADHLEAGVRLWLASDGPVPLSLEQVLFHREGHDLIDWARPNGSLTTYATNLREVAFTGFETVLTARPAATENAWKLRYGRLSYATMQASEQSLGFESNYVLDGLRTKWDLSAGWTLPGEVQADVRWSYQERLGGYTVGGSGEEMPFEPTSQLGISVGKAFTGLGLRAYVRVDNALGAVVMDIGNVQQPGRWVRLGFAYTIR